MILRCLARGRPAVAALLLSLAPVRAAEGELQVGAVVLPFDTIWEWLMILDPGGFQMNPALVDADFYETWKTPAYNGPAFQASPAPLSYGVVDALMTAGMPLGTMMPLPAVGSRATVYCRTTLDLPGELTNVTLEFVADDGFLLDVDGVRWISRNMAAGTTGKFTEMAAIVGNEFALMSTTETDEFQPLPSLAAGRHTIHLSLHNSSFGSSDLGFALRMSGDLLLPPPLPPPPTLAAVSSGPSIDGTPRVLLTAKNLDPATAYIAQSSTDLVHWVPAGIFPAAEERTEFTLDVPATAGSRYFRLAK
jgi:hypothetical protein